MRPAEGSTYSSVSFLCSAEVRNRSASPFRVKVCERDSFSGVRYLARQRPLRLSILARISFPCKLRQLVGRISLHCYRRREASHLEHFDGEHWPPRCVLRQSVTAAMY